MAFVSVIREKVLWFQHGTRYPETGRVRPLKVSLQAIDYQPSN
jgi:hypothetical protein